MHQQTTAELKERLRDVRAFVNSQEFFDYRAMFEADREIARSTYEASAPGTFADFVSREQAMGAVRVYNDLLAWWTDRITALEQAISESESRIEPTTTPVA